MNFFGFLHQRRDLRNLRREHTELQAAHQVLTAERDEAVEACAYFKTRYEQEYERAEAMETRAIDAETVVVCLDQQLAEERQKVAELEGIAGPLRAVDAASPIFDQITDEHPLPVFEDGETTVRIPQAVRTPADALGGAR